ncbi:hypothetical protein B0J11DRAFT_457147 [Dendryphion nanum]|uniref:1-alkyl-2-acetylglycerophosphocholine esterase n=1 Tax=Dendryphion nanum TaxID=256645 RepID=A0A9P9E3D3_9PLEO|nr:hypothetical protein B0J11DRAFT_457147 [Dendryphion nanum]
MHPTTIATLLTFTARAHATIVLPQGTGPYRSTLSVAELIDKSRLDPFNASHVRRLMVSRFDPIPAKACNPIQVPYFPPTTAALENEILAAYDFPKIIEQFVLEVCEDKDHLNQEIGKRKFPIALYSPGLNTTRLFGSSIAQEIASHGFTVITIDHPYDVDITEFPNGDVILGGHVKKPTANSTASVDHAVEVRARDVSFILDTLSIKKGKDQVVMFGQSFGGAATATSLLYDKRIRAGVNVDGTMFGHALNSSLGALGYPQSFVLWGAPGHNTSSDPTWGQFWNTLKQSPYVDYKREFSKLNSTHGSYWDLAVLVDTANIRDNLSEIAKSLIGPDSGFRVSTIMGRYLSAFFSYTLGLKGEDEVLKGPSNEFPEVVQLGR